MNKNHGFTLIELIVTMAVVSIVLLTGIPSLNDMTNNNRLVSQINSIAGSIALARSEAIKTGTVVTICASSDTAACNVTTWESGWIVFTDINRNASVDNIDNDTIIKIQESFNGNTSLRLSVNDAGSAGIYQFLPDGSSRDRDLSGNTVGTFTLCPEDNNVNKAKAININIIGRSSRAEGTPPKDAGGQNDVSCPL